jgi:hypothetical protein
VVVALESTSRTTGWIPEVDSSLFMEYGVDGRDYTDRFAPLFLAVVAGRLLESFPRAVTDKYCAPFNTWIGQALPYTE